MLLNDNRCALNFNATHSHALSLPPLHSAHFCRALHAGAKNAPAHAHSSHDKIQIFWRENLKIPTGHFLNLNELDIASGIHLLLTFVYNHKDQHILYLLMPYSLLLLQNISTNKI